MESYNQEIYTWLFQAEFNFINLKSGLAISCCSNSKIGMNHNNLNFLGGKSLSEFLSKIFNLHPGPITTLETIQSTLPPVPFPISHFFSQSQPSPCRDPSLTAHALEHFQACRINFQFLIEFKCEKIIEKYLRKKSPTHSKEENKP